MSSNLYSLVVSMQSLNEKFKNKLWSGETVTESENLVKSLEDFIPILKEMNTEIAEYNNSTNTKNELEKNISNNITNITGVNQNTEQNAVSMNGGGKKRKTKKKKYKISKRTKYKKKRKK